MKKKILIAVLLTISIITGLEYSRPAFAMESKIHDCLEEPRDLYAKSAVLIDADTGRILYGKNETEPMAMASTTKIMTLIVALEQEKNIDQIAVVSEYATSMPKVKLGLKAGEQYRLKDLYYSLMLESHNDTAVVIAETIAGSVEAFSELMNQKAKEIGAKKTNFVTPNGLDADGHYSTAYDMALIGAYGIKNTRFCEIIAAKSHIFSDLTNQYVHEVHNKNAFLQQMSGAIGIKTGFTGNAGYCFVGATKQENHNLVSCVLASGWPPNKQYKWHDTIALMNYGREQYEYKNLFSSIQSLKEIAIMNGQEPVIQTKCNGSYSALVSKNDTIEVRYHWNKDVTAPIKRGDCVGNVGILINEELVATFPICSDTTVKKKTWYYMFGIILHTFFV